MLLLVARRWRDCRPYLNNWALERAAASSSVLDLRRPRHAGHRLERVDGATGTARALAVLSAAPIAVILYGTSSGRPSPRAGSDT
ncbi:MAG: hypothetical protein ACRDZ4_00105 [Egibacteraceae bacterium]